jgi:hypothetical protein
MYITCKLTCTICIIHISMYEFELIYDWQTHQKNLQSFKKRASPLSQIHGNVYVKYQKNETLTHAI